MQRLVMRAVYLILVVVFMGGCCASHVGTCTSCTHHRIYTKSYPTCTSNCSCTSRPLWLNQKKYVREVRCR